MKDLFCDRILQGDCVEVLNALPENSVDLIFADPPYNLQLQNELFRPNQTLVDGVDDDWDQFDSFTDYDTFTHDWLTACRRVLKENGTIWVIGSYHNIFRVGKIMMDVGYWILNDVQWVKTNPMPNFRGTRFQNATETMIWAKRSEDQKKYTFNYHGMKTFNDDKQMSNVWHIPLCTGAERIKIDGKKAHSTQKPEALLYRVILSSSNPGDVVLDPFFGSGTTGAVAKKLGRHFVGIEREPAYVEVAQARIDSVTPLPPEALNVVASRRGLPRIPFSALIEAGYVRAGQTLRSEDGRHEALIRADAALQIGAMVGSIHKTATHLAGRGANGWDFWHARDSGGAWVRLDAFRTRYREQMTPQE